MIKTDYCGALKHSHTFLFSTFFRCPGAGARVIPPESAIIGLLRGVRWLTRTGGRLIVRLVVADSGRKKRWDADSSSHCGIGE